MMNINEILEKYYTVFKGEHILTEPSAKKAIKEISERIRIEYAISVLEEIHQNNTGQDSLIEIENKITELKNKIDEK